MSLVFIIGTGRCGSSFIHEVLSKHEDVGFISNIEDRFFRLNLKGRYNNSLFRSALGNYTVKGRIRFAPSEAYNLIAKQVSPIYQNSSRNLEASDVTPWLKSRFQKFFLDRQICQGKKVFSHKFTGWSRLGFMNEIFPDAHFIHIVRDGRAVANSWLQMPWWGGYRGPENWLWGELADAYQKEWNGAERSYTLLAGIAWKLLLESYEEGLKEIEKERYLTIKYEDFVDNPKNEMTKILNFINLEWSLGFEQQFNKQHIKSSRRQAFEKELTGFQLAEIEQSLEKKLLKYGYYGN